MNKRQFIAPYVMLGATGGDGGVIGGHTGQGTQDPLTQPISYETWRNDPDLAYDWDGDEHIDYYDCAIWWVECGFTPEQWNQLNPNHPWENNWNSLLG